MKTNQVTAFLKKNRTDLKNKDNQAVSGHYGQNIKVMDKKKIAVKKKKPENFRPYI